MPATRERLALVTGAGSGIGRATAIRLARDGLTVVATDVRLGSAREAAAAAGPGRSPWPSTSATRRPGSGPSPRSLPFRSRCS